MTIEEMQRVLSEDPDYKRLKENFDGEVQSQIDECGRLYKNLRDDFKDAEDALMKKHTQAMEDITKSFLRGLIDLVKEKGIES